MRATYHSSIGLTAYADLLRLHLDDAAAEIRGTIERKERNGRTYIYDRYRIGQRSVSRYIGEATDALEARLKRLAELRETEDARRREKTRLIRLLRAEGYTGVDAATGSMLTALERIGMFRLGGTIVGTIAFRLYEAELGLRIGTSRLAHTGDLDVASFHKLSLALEDRVTEATDDVLRELRFDPVPGLDRNRTWRWRDSSRNALVEFLTPAFGDEGLKDLPALGVSAQALHYLKFLLADPIKAVALYRSGILVQIPRPEAYAIHKLIVADRRQAGPEELKSRKDRAQAALLVEALAEMRPDELAEAYDDALSRGHRWRARIEASLKRMPETAERLAALV